MYACRVLKWVPLALAAACGSPAAKRPPIPAAIADLAPPSAAAQSPTSQAQRPEPTPAPAPVPWLTVPPGALKATRSFLTGERSVPFRVVQYGDSHSAAGLFTREARRLFSGAGHTEPGFVTAGYPSTWDGKVILRGRWRKDNWLRTKADGPFGPLGIAYTTREPSARMILRWEASEPTPSRFRVTVHYSAEVSTLPFEVLVEGRPAARSQRTDQDPASGSLGTLQVEVPAGVTTAELAVDCREGCSRGGTLRIFGFLVERLDPAVGWDTMAVGGTTIDHPRRRGDETIEAYLTQREPDLLVLWYGSNSAVDKHFDPDRYRARFDELLTRLRAASPEAECLVLAPPDLDRWPDATCFLNKAERRAAQRARKSPADRKLLKRSKPERVCDPDALVRTDSRGRVYPVPEVRSAEAWEAYKASCALRTVTTVPEIVRIQREVALSHACAYFDVYSFMGGPESIQRWACAEPRLAMFDLVHLTAAGYREVAGELHRSILALESP